MDYELSEHARRVLAKRKIRIEWLEAALAQPEIVEDDDVDEDLKHHLARIKDYADRVLRVIVNDKATPRRIVTAYFDRGMRGKI
jgi:hypothetical protein